MRTTKITTEAVQVVRERLMCECGGEYKSTGCGKMGIVAQYQHQCDSCRDIDWFAVVYPQIVYVGVEDE
jgi:hypothetical protein